MTSVHELLDLWERWVTELEMHPLDEFEYEAALEARDRLAVELEVAGTEKVWRRADDVDARFQALTTQTTSSPFTRPDAAGGWWRRRLPSDTEYLGYLGLRS